MLLNTNDSQLQIKFKSSIIYIHAIELNIPNINTICNKNFNIHRKDLTFCICDINYRISLIIFFFKYE